VAFSPNGDNLNDNFWPAAIKKPGISKNYTLRIFLTVTTGILKPNLDPYKKMDGVYPQVV
jgi:hypothetical protein